MYIYTYTYICIYIHIHIYITIYFFKTESTKISFREGSGESGKMFVIPVRRDVMILVPVYI